MSEDKASNHTAKQTKQSKKNVDEKQSTEKSQNDTGTEPLEPLTSAEAGAVENNSSSKPKHKRQPKTGSTRPFPWVAVTVLLLILALGAGNYWQYQQGQLLIQSQAKFTQQLSDATTGIMSLDSRLNETSEQQKSLAQKTQLNEQSQQSLQAMLEQMSQQLKELAIAKGKEPLFWKVSEVEYLLSVANNRLLLEQDVTTAQSALQDADTRLRAIGDPGLIPIRKKVANEIDLLKQVKLPDVAGMAAQLSTMAGAIENLPFVKTIRDLESVDKSGSAQTGDSDSSNVSSSISQFIKDIIDMFFTIDRVDEPIEPLLPPEEKQFLKHNLNLKVEEARIALLRQETPLFQKNLDDIERWIKNYFDEKDQTVINLLQSAAELKQVNLQPALPDISGSLRDLKSWMSQQKQVALEMPAEKTPTASIALSGEIKVPNNGSQR